MGANNQLYERSPEIYKATVTGGQPWLLPEDYSPDAEKMHEDYLRINDKAVSLSESAAKDIAQAKEGLSALEQAGVDISVNLIQMGMDAAGRAVGLGMLPFFMLTAGGAMLEAEQEGADSWGQLGYGLTKATIEVGTEKLFDGLAGVFGKGAADDVIEGLIGKLTGSNTGRTLLRAFAGAAGEGTEEVISDLLDPFAKLIYNDQALKEAWENRADLRDQMLYDFLIGAAMGGFGSVVSIATGQNAEKNAKLGEADARKQANPAPQPPAEQKNTALSQAESTTVNTDPAQHTAAEQAVIDEYHAAVDDKLVKYIETVRANKGAKIERYSLKPVAERAAKDIMQLTGVDASGNQTAIEARIIEHILKRHGENGTANHSMRDINDIARIQYVLDNYDTAAYGGKSQAYQTVKPNGRPGQADTVIFSKAVNGTYYVIEAVPVTKKKTVFITSAYMSKQKAGDVQTADADAWRVTSETKNAQTPAVEDKASINSISQSGQKYNSNDQSAEVTGSVGERAAKGSPLGGAVERSETEGATAAKPTDPAEAAAEREYRRLVENAITEGDFQRALALYREYNNPALRAYKEFYTLKTFSEYAASQGYILASETAIGADSIPFPFEESKRQTLKQEWEEAAPPKEYDGVFDDFAELNLSRGENNALRELQSLSALSGYEYCIIIADGKASEPMTSESKNSVGFLLDQYPGRVTLLHSHTNATPPSVSDLRMLLNEKVEKIGSIGYNGDCYIAYNDYGYIPSLDEFNDVVKDISKEVDRELKYDPNFYNWSFPERNYMAIREQAYRIVRYFEWTMEGGRIDE